MTSIDRIDAGRKNSLCTSLMNLFIRGFCFLLTIHVSIFAFSQDTTWKNASITPDLSISLPESIYTLDTAQMKIVNSQAKGYFFQRH